jgi:hypothetical protein
MTNRMVMVAITIAALICLASCFLLIELFNIGRERNSDVPQFKREKFTVIAFPLHAKVNMAANRLHGDLMPLNRAIILELGEHESQSETATCYINDNEYLVSKSDLIFSPPHDYLEYIHRLNQEFISWGDHTDWARVDVNILSNNPDGSCDVALTIRDKKQKKIEYMYTAKKNFVEPKSTAILIR